METRHVRRNVGSPSARLKGSRHAGLWQRRPTERPAHFVMIGWSESRVIEIRDFLFAPYVLERIGWARSG
jgi:hypothetical protein